MEITCERHRERNTWVGAIHFTDPWFLCNIGKKLCRSSSWCQMAHPPDADVCGKPGCGSKIVCRVSAEMMCCMMMYLLLTITSHLPCGSWIGHFIPEHRRTCNYLLTPTYPHLDPHLPAARALLPGQVCRCECHVNVGKLLPGQLSFAGSTTALVQHGIRRDKHCSVSAVPTQSQGWCLPITSPKQREQWRDALVCTWMQTQLGTWDPGWCYQEPQNAAFLHNLGHAAVPSRGDLCAFALWPIETPHPQKPRLTADNTWVKGTPGPSWPESGTWAQHVCLHPACLFTVTLKHPYPKSPRKPKWSALHSRQGISGPHCLRRKVSPLAAVDGHVAMSY